MLPLGALVLPQVALLHTRRALEGPPDHPEGPRDHPPPAVTRRSVTPSFQPFPPAFFSAAAASALALRVASAALTSAA